jgi:hypothetical protein
MFFTVAIDLPEGGFFEYSTESILQFLQAVQAFGNTDIEEVEDNEDDESIPEEITQYFVDGEEYTYDEDADCYCWYDEQHEAWYWLDVESGEWLLVEDSDGFETEEEAEEA